MQVCLLCAALSSGAAAAGEIPGFGDTPVGLEDFGPPDKSYVVPNETFTHKLAPIVKDAPKGVYISVGTERGFIGASLAENTSHLLLLDRDPRVVFFNRMNAALLDLAKEADPLDYLKLRLSASHDEWLAALKARPHLSGTAAMLQSRANWEWWRVWARDSKSWKRYYRPWLANIPDPDEFRKSIYWNNKELFVRLQGLAKRGRIIADVANLNRSVDAMRITENLQNAGLRISVLDLSNTWHKAYLGKSDSEYLVSMLEPVSKKRSVVVFTDYDFKYREIKNHKKMNMNHKKMIEHMKKTGKPVPFVYRAYTFGYIAGRNGDIPVHGVSNFLASRDRLVTGNDSAGACLKAVIAVLREKR